MEIVWSSQFQEAVAIQNFQYLEDYELIIAKQNQNSAF